MIITLEQTEKKSAGGKAAALGKMKKSSLPVPAGFVLPRQVWDRAMEPAAHEIAAVLAGAEASEEKSSRLQVMAEQLPLPEDITAELARLQDPEKYYAVRSSGIQEDLPGYSFAGQYTTVLNVRGTEEIIRAVGQCYASAFSVEVLEYLHQNQLPIADIAMAVIIQEMVPAEKSGVVFTLNPLTGNDHQMVIEVARGLGEQLVQGQVEAQRVCWDWMAEEITEKPPESPLTAEELNRLTALVLQVMELFGHPCDIEFAIYGGEVFLLQSRPITKVMHHGLRDIWTTADFKDGGVSAAVCTPFMWSLYEYAWENSFCGFLKESRLIAPENLRKSGEMYYGRPYWNLSMAKEAMARVPGYKEREFDSEYGITGDYVGDGKVTRYTPGVLLKLADIAKAYGKIVNERLDNMAAIHNDLDATCWDYSKQMQRGGDADWLESTWRQLTQQDYLASEGAYFRQIFINTVEQALFKDSILKYTDQEGYFALIGGLDEISHLMPFYAMWGITRQIREDAEALAWWSQRTPREIAEAEADGFNDCYVGAFGSWISRYGYHSEKELDITYPNFHEVPETVAAMFLETLALEDDCDPGRDRERQKALYKAAMEKVRQTNPGKGDKLAAKVERMRRLLWWREEFRDVSTKYYNIIRQYSLALGWHYSEIGLLEQQEDIWFLKIGDIWDYMDKGKTAEDLQQLVKRNRRYYSAYRNYISDNEIGADFAPAESQSGQGLKGIGCTVGAVTGTARVIAGLEDIGRLQQGDILVTRFTDTGWTSKFALLGGVVTEYGGMLCHAAIVSREYGLPCAVCVKDATAKIPDGAQIHLNGATGEITLLETTG